MRQLVTHALSLLVLIPMLARGATPGPVLEPVEVREYDGGWGRKGVQLIFKRLPPDRDQGALTREDGHAIRAAFEEVYGKQEPLPPPRYPGGTRLASVGTQYVSTAPPEWQEKIRKDYEELYRKGPSALALPSNLENSRFFQALRLSPRYMGEGAREAAMETNAGVSSTMRLMKSRATSAGLDQDSINSLQRSHEHSGSIFPSDGRCAHSGALVCPRPMGR